MHWLGVQVTHPSTPLTLEMNRKLIAQQFQEKFMKPQVKLPALYTFLGLIWHKATFRIHDMDVETCKGQTRRLARLFLAENVNKALRENPNFIKEVCTCEQNTTKPHREDIEDWFGDYWNSIGVTFSVAYGFHFDFVSNGPQIFTLHWMTVFSISRWYTW